MADLQDIIKRIEEERKKAAEKELKQQQDATGEQEEHNRKISNLTQKTREKQIRSEKNLQNANEEHARQQTKMADLKEKLNSDQAKNNVRMQEGLKRAIQAQEAVITKINQETQARQAIVNADREVHNQELAIMNESVKKQTEIAKKKDLIQKLQEKQLNGFKKVLLGANKTVAGLKEGLQETTIGKMWSLGKSLIGKDPEVEEQQRQLRNLEEGRGAEEVSGNQLGVIGRMFNVEGALQTQTEREGLLNSQAISEESTSDEPQQVEIIQNSTSDEPQPVKVVAVPPPEKDAFAEEKANEAANVQAEQAETQERIADALESQQDDQSVEIKGKDTGIFGKILGGQFNPLKAIQGIVSGLFGVINEFIKGIGNILKSALEVVQKLVKGVGDILLTLVDIVGKGFVKIMGFAGQGIAALFKALGSIPPQALLIGAAAIGVLTLAFMGLGKGLQMMTPAIKELANIPLSNFLELAGGLAVLAIPLGAFGVAAAVATPGILGLAVGVGALGLAMRILAPTIETIVPPITDMLGSFGDFLSTLQGIVSRFFDTIGNFIATVGTAISDFISNFAQSMILLNDADFLHLAGGFGALGLALAAFGATAWVAIPSLIALGKASSGLADLIDVPPDRFDALRESFKLLGHAVKEFAKDAKGLGKTNKALDVLSRMPFAKKLLKAESETSETRNIVDNFKGGIAEAIQPVDIVSFSGAKTERSIEMLKRASETKEIRDESAMGGSSPASVVTTAVTDASSVTNNAIVVQDSPTDNSFRASVGTYGP